MINFPMKRTIKESNKFQMEANDDQNTYVMETIDYNNVTYNIDDSKEGNLKETPILICSNDDSTSEYITCYENGKIVLKKIENIVRRTIKATTTTIKVEQKRSKQVLKDETKKPATHSSPVKKNVSYKTVFKPATIINNKNMQGLIRYGRKHLVIDQQIMISPRQFKSQLNNTEDLVINPELAPCTKQQIRHVLTGFTKLFAYPAHNMPSSKLLQLYVSNCTCKKELNMETNTDMELLPLDFPTPIDHSKIKRISRKRKSLETEGNSEETHTENTIQNDQTIENGDHKYSKQMTSGNKEETMKINPDNSIANEENLITISLDQLQQETVNDNQIVIIQRLDDTCENNLEILLAAANKSTEIQSDKQIMTIYNDCEENKYKNIIVVRDDLETNNVQEILGM